ncbi:hypothetical protein ABIB30_004324 [Pedobacter sp. UYP1]
MLKVGNILFAGMRNFISVSSCKPYNWIRNLKNRFKDNAKN